MSRVTNSLELWPGLQRLARQSGGGREGGCAARVPRPTGAGEHGPRSAACEGERVACVVAVLATEQAAASHGADAADGGGVPRALARARHVPRPTRPRSTTARGARPGSGAGGTARPQAELAASVVNDREIASVAWLALVLVAGATKPDVRTACWQVVKSFLHPKVLGSVVVLAAWTVGLAALAHQVGLWESDVLSDTVVWFLTGGHRVLLLAAERGRARLLPSNGPTCSQALLCSSNCFKAEETTQKLLLPVWLTLGVMPLIYAVGLWSAYEQAFVRIHLATDDRASRRSAKWALLRVAHLRATDVSAFRATGSTTSRLLRHPTLRGESCGGSGPRGESNRARPSA